MEEERVYYNHDGGCSRTNFTEPNARGLKTCLDCAGIFDSDGNGVCTMDSRIVDTDEIRTAKAEEQQIHNARLGRN